jgi:hypothetical protein
LVIDPRADRVFRGITVIQQSRVVPDLELAAVDRVGQYDVDQSVVAVAWHRRLVLDGGWPPLRTRL